MEQKKKIKITIIVLAVLLALSLIALGVTLHRGRTADGAADAVVVPDNLITPAEDDGSAADTDVPGGTEQQPETKKSESGSVPPAAPAAVTGTAPADQASAAASRKATAIALYARHPQDNAAFQVGNMFPGDSETRYFCVQVSHKGSITVYYHADIRPGYEKLAEVLKTRITLLTTGEMLYDGLMRDMPESLTHKLAGKGRTTDELYYEITCYLDTSVGNEYQNKDLIADFSWWVEEKEQGGLTPSPKTGDTAQILLWIAAAAASGCVIVWLRLDRRRKGGNANG